MRVILTAIGGRPTHVPLCAVCGDLVFGRPAGGRCQNPRCKKFYSDLEISAALGLVIDTSEPVPEESAA